MSQTAVQKAAWWCMDHALHAQKQDRCMEHEIGPHTHTNPARRMHTRCATGGIQNIMYPYVIRSIWFVE